MSRGAETTHQNAVYIGAQFAEHTARRLANLSAGESAVYPFTGVATQLDILRHELVFVFKNDGTARKFQKARVLSALNGAGSEIVRAFPDNTDLQRDLLLEHLQIIGTSDQDIPYDTVTNNSADSGRDFQVQQVGIANHVATEPMVVGGLLEYYLPESHPVRGRSFVSASNGRTPNKATVELRHFNPSLAGEFIAHRIQSMIFDQRKWELLARQAGSQSTFSRTGPVWLACAAAWKAMSGMTGLLFLYRFIGYLAEDYGRLGLALAFQGAAGPLDAAAAETAFNKNFAREFNTDGANSKAQPYTSYKYATYPLLSLAKKLGIADNNTSLANEGDALLFTSLEQLSPDKLEDLMRQFFGSLVWKGTHKELGFGLNHEMPNNINSPFMGPTGAPRFDNTFGDLVFKQLNIPKIYFSAITQMVSFRMANIAGTVTRSSGVAGELFAYNKA
jgi:hypothetical protein